MLCAEIESGIANGLSTDQLLLVFEQHFVGRLHDCAAATVTESLQ